MNESTKRVISAAYRRAGGLYFAAYILVSVLYLAAVLFFVTMNPGKRDFVEYWAAQQQLMHGADPYDGPAIFQLERGAGFGNSGPLISYSPPVAWDLGLPLGLLSVRAGVVLWLLLMLTCVGASCRMIRVLAGRPRNRLHLLGYVFAPTMACLMFGQIGIFFLLGIVLFLYLQNSRPFLAGAALLPLALKPHLFGPFGVALLLWVVSRRVYPILAGFLVSFAVNCGLTLCFDPHIWTQYADAMKKSVVLNVFPFSLSAMLRLFVARDAVWLQFLPVEIACAWTVWYFWTRRSRWNWMDHGMLVLLVSAMCAPYAWMTDEAMLLPAVLTGLYRAQKSPRSLMLLGAICGIALIELVKGVSITSRFYLWTTPAWLAWYLIAGRAPDEQRVQEATGT
jgi:hypothetical protein